MQKEKYYWKVVREINGKFYSVVIHSGKYSLEYKIGRKIVAPRQGIFVFDTRKLAREFVNDILLTCRLRILKVRATGLEIEHPKFYQISDLVCNVVRLSDSPNFPLGTKCFKSIIPIEVSH